MSHPMLLKLTWIASEHLGLLFSLVSFVLAFPSLLKDKEDLRH